MSRLAGEFPTRHRLVSAFGLDPPAYNFHCRFIATEPIKDWEQFLRSTAMAANCRGCVRISELLANVFSRQTAAKRPMYSPLTNLSTAINGKINSWLESVMVNPGLNPVRELLFAWQIYQAKIFTIHYFVDGKILAMRLAVSSEMMKSIFLILPLFPASKHSTILGNAYAKIRFETIWK